MNLKNILPKIRTTSRVAAFFTLCLTGVIFDFAFKIFSKYEMTVNIARSVYICFIIFILLTFGILTFIFTLIDIYLEKNNSKLTFIGLDEKIKNFIVLSFSIIIVLGLVFNYFIKVNNFVKNFTGYASILLLIAILTGVIVYILRDSIIKGLKSIHDKTFTELKFNTIEQYVSLLLAIASVVILHTYLAINYLKIDLNSNFFGCIGLAYVLLPLIVYLVSKTIFNAIKMSKGGNLFLKILLIILSLASAIFCGYLAFLYFRGVFKNEMTIQSILTTIVILEILLIIVLIIFRFTSRYLRGE